MKQVLVAGLLGVMAASLANAQTFTGGVRGAVREADDVVPGVTVQLVNEASNAIRETVSNEAGEYDFSAVPPGTYTVRASLAGFKTYERRGIRIAAQQFVTLDVVLELGDLQETVTVTGQAPIVDTSNASIGTVLDGVAAQLAAVRGSECVHDVRHGAHGRVVRQPGVHAAAGPEPSFPRLAWRRGAARQQLSDRRCAPYRPGQPSLRQPVVRGDRQRQRAAAHLRRRNGADGRRDLQRGVQVGRQRLPGERLLSGAPERTGGQQLLLGARRLAEAPDSYFHNCGGAFGGPIVRNRTFFWYSMEGYKSLDSRSSTLRVPTSRERAGDFSQSFNAAGQLVVIYDPLTTRVDPVTGQQVRDPFPGNVIPADRLNPVAQNIMRLLSVRHARGEQRERQLRQHRRSDRLRDRVQHEDRPSVFGHGVARPGSTSPTRPRGPTRISGSGARARTASPTRATALWTAPCICVALNNTWLPANNTVLTLRYGYTRLQDDDSTTIDFDPSQLGFSPTYLNAMQVRKFPVGSIADYEGFGAVDPTDRIWDSWSANGTLSSLIGRHTLKFGVDFRLLGVDTQSFTGGSGDLRFDRFYTSANPLANGTATSGNAFASFLLGYPSGDPGNQSRFSVSTPLSAFVKYYGVYAQDDFRVSPKLTLNYGLRLEHEDGLRERDNQFTVAFDRALNPGGALGNVVVNGAPVRGGLVYAGQGGANDYQGDPAGGQALAAFRASRIRSIRRRSLRGGLRCLLGALELPARQRRQLRPDRLRPPDVHQPGTVRADDLSRQSVSRTAPCSLWATRWDR